MPRPLHVCALGALLASAPGPRAEAQNVPPPANRDSASDSAADSDWHLFALEYAHSTRVEASRLVQGASSSDPIDMSWYFFVALGHGRVVLIDCGTDALAAGGSASLRASWSVTRGVRAVEALARLGLEVADVTDVVITHHHWDHVGALSSFRSARIHVHEGVWARVPERLRRVPEREHRVRTSRRRERILWPGFVVRVSGWHTRHHSMVELRCADRSVVIASDAAYLYRNIERGLPVAVSASAARNVADIARAVEAVGLANVLPGHDPAVFERYSSDADGVAGICP